MSASLSCKRFLRASSQSLRSAFVGGSAKGPPQYPAHGGGPYPRSRVANSNTSAQHQHMWRHLLSPGNSLDAPKNNLHRYSLPQHRGQRHPLIVRRREPLAQNDVVALRFPPVPQEGATSLKTSKSLNRRGS